MAGKKDARTPAETASQAEAEEVAKAEAAAAKEAEKVAKASAKAQSGSVNHPDTPSGEGLKAAAGLDGAEAAEAYAEAKRKARWG